MSKISFICSDDTPYFTHGGTGMTAWGIFDALILAGHKVQVVSRVQERPDINLRLHALQQRGAAVVPVMGSPANEEQMREVITGVTQHVNAFQPDAILAFPVNGLVWASGVSAEVPRVCLFGDLAHELTLHRVQFHRRQVPLGYDDVQTIINQSEQVKDNQLQALSTCVKVGNFAAHHAQWLKDNGVDAAYTPMPVIDSAFMGWRRRKEDMPKNEKPQILLAGHLGGIATLSGLYYLVESVLPAMDPRFKYDMKICGAEGLNPHLSAQFANYDQVQFAGFVQDIRKEMLQADIFLCPTPVTLGMRTRLIEAMSLGSFIVAHPANAHGMPELVDGYNCILINSGEDMARKIKAFSKMPDHRYAIGLNARRTYEKVFAPEVAGLGIVQMVEEVL